MPPSIDLLIYLKLNGRKQLPNQKPALFSKGFILKAAFISSQVLHKDGSSPETSERGSCFPPLDWLSLPRTADEAHLLLSKDVGLHVTPTGHTVLLSSRGTEMLMALQLKMVLGASGSSHLTCCF